MHFHKGGKNTGTRLIQWRRVLPPGSFLRSRRQRRGFDKRQEDVRCIRGVNQATCLWASAWWYGMAPSSSGAILSMSVWFSRLNTQQQITAEGVRPGKSPASTVSPICHVRFSTDLYSFYWRITKSYCNFNLRLCKQQTNKAGWVPVAQRLLLQNVGKANIPIIKPVRFVFVL